MTQVRILRPVSGINADIGDVVDASRWRTLRQLIATRYVELVERAPDEPQKRRGRQSQWA